MTLRCTKVFFLMWYHQDELGEFANMVCPVVPDPCNSDVLASQECKVDDIVTWCCNRAKHNCLEFLLRWKGYRPTEDSWVSEYDLHNAQDLLREFQAKHPASRK